jgi:GNAT superfamily N-acetyltransferase
MQALKPNITGNKKFPAKARTAVTVRQAVAQDVPELLKMIRELARYEKSESAVKISVKQLLEDGFSASPAFRCLLAQMNGKTVGYCLFWYRYSTWRGRIIYVEDLFVRSRYRRKGIGKILLDAVGQMAESEGCKWLSLQVLDWNEPAILFYRKYEKAEWDDGWVNVLIPVKTQEA